MLDSLLGGAGSIGGLAVVLLLWRSGACRSLPVFFLYLCWDTVSDAFFLVVSSRWPQVPYGLYEVHLVIDSALIFGVLVELAWSVLSPIKKSLPRGSWLLIALLIALAGLALWPVAGLTLPYYVTQQGKNFFRLQQTFAILRVLVFLLLAGFSQLLAIGWRNRELQIATGLGFYSIVALAASVFHAHQQIGIQYHWIDQIASLSYLSALVYWVLAFSTKEAERQDFSPQMLNFLLLVSSTARAGRVALTGTGVTNSRRKDRE